MVPVGFWLGVAPVLAQSGSSFDERLDVLAEQVERHRVELNVPGAALVVVHEDEVVFARGFGVADLARGTPVTADTRFFIGSTTKAFTSTLLGMLVDDGRLDWDDAVTGHLPDFSLAIDTDDPDAQPTIRDLLTHRTGFPRMNTLWAGGALSPDEILRQLAHAEPSAPFRRRWQYNNVMYLAAGRAGAAAGGASWAKLLEDRILTPLGMQATQTAVRGSDGPDLALGYRWVGDAERFDPLSPGVDKVGSDPIAPAGSISSTARDMGQWVRFLLAEGVVDGDRLISEAALTETWTGQIDIGNGARYGLGWMVRDWQGQPLIEHGGNLYGFSAQVALLPESDLGFALLTNASVSALAPMAVTLVPNTLLGPVAGEEEAARDGGDLGPYLGRYVANFASFSNEVFTVLEQDGRLSVAIPSQRVYELDPPGEDGRWPFTLTDQIAVSFQRDETGGVVSLTMHQSGMDWEVLREGIVVEPEIDLDEARRLLGTYRTANATLEIGVLIQNQRLAIRVPGAGVLELHAPNDEGRSASRANPEIAVAFDEDDSGVSGLRFWRPGGRPPLELALADAAMASLPTVDELLALGGIADREAEVGAYRVTGAVRFPHTGVDGRFEITVAGDDRYRLEVDLGRFGRIRLSLDGSRGWRDTTYDMEPFAELSGSMLAQTRLEHPSVIWGDWRRGGDTARVLRRSEVDDRTLYIVQLESEGLPPMRVGIDAETGDVATLERTIVLPDIGGVPVRTTFHDYRDVDGLRIPFRQVESNAASGRTVYEVEQVELNLNVPADAFVLRPADEP
jgi:CubicO group peptidase (beta-lactamase class C family)